MFPGFLFCNKFYLKWLLRFPCSFFYNYVVVCLYILRLVLFGWFVGVHAHTHTHTHIHTHTHMEEYIYIYIYIYTNKKHLHRLKIKRRENTMNNKNLINTLEKNICLRVYILSGVYIFKNTRNTFLSIHAKNIYVDYNSS